MSLPGWVMGLVLALVAGPTLLPARTPDPGSGSAPGPGNPSMLCLSETYGGQPVTQIATGPDGTFELSFIHSVSKTPVSDRYRITADGILQTAEVFQAHGAGLPSFVGDVDATGWRHEDGRFILDMARPTDPIHLRVQADYENALHADGTDYVLAQFGVQALTITLCPDGA